MSGQPKRGLSEVFHNGSGTLTKELFTWLFRVGLLAGVFWVQGNFVSKDRYERDRELSVSELHTIATNVQKITDRLETAADLPSYETRIKRMESEIHELQQHKK